MGIDCRSEIVEMPLYSVRFQTEWDPKEEDAAIRYTHEICVTGRTDQDAVAKIRRAWIGRVGESGDVCLDVAIFGVHEMRTAITEFVPLVPMVTYRPPVEAICRSCGCKHIGVGECGACRNAAQAERGSGL